MHIRPMTGDDIPACREVFFDAEDDLYDRRGLPHLPRGSDALDKLLAHIVASDAERCWLAEDDGQVVAFGMASQRDRFWFLSFLFVRPAGQGRGLGRRLMQRCLPAEGSADVLGVCVEAIQPVSTGLYATFGLVPRVPLYTLIGTPRRELGRLPQSHRSVAFDELAEGGHEQLVALVNDLDREILGYARPGDHRAFRIWDRLGFMFYEGERAVGYGYASTAGRIGPVVVRDQALLLPAAGELTSLVEPIDAWQLLVPGLADETMVALLAAGLRFDGPPALYCATRGGPDLKRYLPGTFALL